MVPAPVPSNQSPIAASSHADVSIVIPLGPHEHTPPPVFEFLPRTQAEIILSSTGPLDVSVPAHWRQIHGRSGRGRQQNRGARHALGKWLWFLHADSRPDQNAWQGLLMFLQSQPHALGYCDLRFLNDGPRMTRLNAIGANVRSRWFRLPYGDQGLCLPRTAFEQLGGFREDYERGEDLDLVVRARLAGWPIRPIGATITTSSRRYREKGWLMTTWHHQRSAWRLSREARRKSAET